MPRYRFEALFHMCTYADYEDMNKFPNRYDDRRTIRQNLIRVYDQLAEFVARYMPDKFYMSPETGQREDLRWNLMREIVGNMCVHTDFSSGYACFFHVFKDRVLTKNPTRLLPEIPEGELTIHQLSNYTKNPLLARVFHELHWVEDLGSGVRNILRYAPLYYPKYNIEINSGQQFLFSITYADAQESGQMSKGAENVQGQMSKENVQELSDGELSLKPFESKRSKDKKKRRIQAIMSMIAKNSHVSLTAMANQLDVSTKTIWRDLTELKEQGVLERIGDDFNGEWKILKKKK